MIVVIKAGDTGHFWGDLARRRVAKNHETYDSSTFGPKSPGESGAVPVEYPVLFRI